MRNNNASQIWIVVGIAVVVSLIVSAITAGITGNVIGSWKEPLMGKSLTLNNGDTTTLTSNAYAGELNAKNNDLILSTTRTVNDGVVHPITFIQNGNEVMSIEQNRIEPKVPIVFELNDRGNDIHVEIDHEGVSLSNWVTDYAGNYIIYQSGQMTNGGVYSAKENGDDISITLVTPNAIYFAYGNEDRPSSEMVVAKCGPDLSVLLNQTAKFNYTYPFSNYVPWKCERSSEWEMFDGHYAKSLIGKNKSI